MSDKKPIGRPKLPPGDQQVYQRIAVYPQTHKRIKRNAKVAKQTIVDYLEDREP